MTQTRTPMWPLYFAAVDVPGRFAVAAGHPFLFQDKGTIVRLGPSLGVPDALDRPFSTLPYVRVLNVLSGEMAKTIQEQNLSFDAALAVVAKHGGTELLRSAAAPSDVKQKAKRAA